MKSLLIVILFLGACAVPAAAEDATAASANTAPAKSAPATSAPAPVTSKQAKPKHPKAGPEQTNAEPIKLDPTKPEPVQARRARSAAPVAAPGDLPQQFAPPQEAYASFPETGPKAVAAEPSACQQQLAKLAVFEALPTLVGAGECGATDAVLLKEVVLPDRSKVAVTPPATLRCTMATELAAWLRDDVARAALKLGAPLREVDNFNSYECRSRNRVRGGILSEHGRANAIDVRGFRLANGRSIGLTDVNFSKEWRDGVRASACARFHTVLGPGSDGYHEEHIHLDLAERRSGYTTCEWDVRVPPPPDKVAPSDAATPVAAASDAAPSAIAAASNGATAGAIPLPRPRPNSANNLSAGRHRARLQDDHS